MLLRNSIFAVDPVSPPLQTSVWVMGTARTAVAAGEKRDAARTRAITYLKQRGFSDAQVSPEPPRPVDYDKDSHEYKADQIVDVRSSTFPPLARAMNALPRDVDPTERSVSGTFPMPPFLSLAISVCVLYLVLLTVGVAAMETREADVNRAPSGMHPFYVGAQTLLIGSLFAFAVVDAHTLLPLSRLPFILTAALGAGMLVLWLFKTRSSWRQTAFLRCAFVAYVAATAAVVVAGVIALLVPLT